MRIAATADISELAHLAQRRDDEIRPLLLRVHTEAFAASPRRCRIQMDAYEALALGLLPLVPDDVVAETQLMLRDVPEVPARVTSALRSRLARTGSAAPEAGSDAEAAALARKAADPATLNALILRAEPAIDLAIAGNRAVRIDGHALATLVERARRDRALAVALLDRPEPTLFDRAALYAFADETTRDRIRLELAVRLPALGTGFPGGGGTVRDAIVADAEAGDRAALFGGLAALLGLEAGWSCDLADPAGREIFVLALSAAGLSVPDCIRVILVIDTQMARSVGSVFRLAAIARETPRPVAALLVGRDPRPAAAPARPADDGERRAANPVRGHSASVSGPAETRSAAHRDPSAPAGHRWRSTTGRDRI